MNILAVLSELQAGLPVRLVGCAWIMIASVVNGGLKTENVDIVKLENTASFIAEYEFIDDRSPGSNVAAKQAVVEKYGDEVFKWMDCAPTKLDFEKMILNEFPQEQEAFKLRQPDRPQIIIKRRRRSSSVRKSLSCTSPEAGSDDSESLSAGGSTPRRRK